MPITPTLIDDKDEDIKTLAARALNTGRANLAQTRRLAAYVLGDEDAARTSAVRLAEIDIPGNL